MSLLCDEHTFVKHIAMPFLRENWDFIDRPEGMNSHRDGRLTLDELMLSHVEATCAGRAIDALILDELIIRYDVICRSHSDGYWSGDESVLGISEADVSVYAQMSAPEYRKRSGVPHPTAWL